MAGRVIFAAERHSCLPPKRGAFALLSAAAGGKNEIFAIFAYGTVLFLQKYPQNGINFKKIFIKFDVICKNLLHFAKKRATI